MNAVEILATLQKSGKPQTAAVYKRHGSGDNVFGALTSEIAKLQKKIKVNHTLANPTSNRCRAHGETSAEPSEGSDATNGR